MSLVGTVSVVYELHAGSVAAGQCIGSRDRQEDEFGYCEIAEHSVDGMTYPGHVLLVVADGAGGHVNGHIASEMATSEFIEVYQNCSGNIGTRLNTALEQSNLKIRDAVMRNSNLSGMATTLVGAVIDGTQVHWVSVGDSTLHIVRDGTLIRINEDHSMRGVVQSDPESDVASNVLRSAMYGEEIPMIDRSEQPVNLSTGDFLLAATDGLEILTEDTITTAFRSDAHNGAIAAVDELTTLVAEIAQSSESVDNTTILACTSQLAHDRD